MATQKQILETLVEDIASMKSKLPNGEIKRMEIIMSQMQENQRELKEDVREIKKVLLDPVGGVVAKTLRNTSFREACEPERAETMEKFKAVLRWKGNMDKALWVLFTAVTGVIVKLSFFA